MKYKKGKEKNKKENDENKKEIENKERNYISTGETNASHVVHPIYLFIILSFIIQIIYI